MLREIVSRFMQEFGSYLTKDSIDFGTDKYIKGRFWWSLSSCEIRDDKDCSYEKTLKDFLSRNPGSILRKEMDDNTLILRGGIGTGKTTTLKKFFKEIIQNPRHCPSSKEERSYCTKTPRYFELDYRTAISPDSEEETELFWTFTEGALHKQYDSFREKDYNLIEFLEWCSNKVNLIRNEKDIQGFVLRLIKSILL